VKGNGHTTQLLWDPGANINSGYSALHLSSLGGHEAVVKLLLDQGADINAEGGYFALNLTDIRGNGHEIYQFLSQGAYINAQHGCSALQLASLGGHEAVVKLLLDRKANINAGGGCFGLSLTHVQGNGHQIYQFQGQGARINDLASLKGHEALVKLLEQWTNSNAESGSLLVSHTHVKGNGHQIYQFQGPEAHINAQYGCSALHLASLGGHEAVVKLLLEQGANINADYRCFVRNLSVKGNGHQICQFQGPWDQTNSQNRCSALQLASFGRHEAVVKLLEQGADINEHQICLFRGPWDQTNSQNRCSALQLASLGGHEAVVKLLEQGAEINAESGCFALNLTVEGNGHEIYSFC
jgi:ankyrin repeat protein